jgi:hypothetical protein
MEQPGDEPALARFAGDLQASGEDFRVMVQKIIADPAFGYRVEAP